MKKSVEFALSLAVDAMNERKKQEERNLELEKLITEKEEIISKLQNELQEQKEEIDALRNSNQKRGIPGKSKPDLAPQKMVESAPRGVNLMVHRWPVPQTKKDIGSSKLVSRHVPDDHTDNFVAEEDQGRHEKNHDSIWRNRTRDYCQTAEKHCSKCRHPFNKNEDLERATKKQRIGNSEQVNAACSDDSNSATGSNKRSKTDKDESWIVGSAVSGGPFEASVIPSFLGHVASRMLWAETNDPRGRPSMFRNKSGELRGVLNCPNKLSVRSRLKEWYMRMSEKFPRGRTMIDKTGLSHLQSTMFDHLDIPLISAFIERWQPDTNSFHMPFGEMTIMLHDVWYILRIPVEGRMIFDDPDIFTLQCDCFQILGVSLEEVKSDHWLNGGVLTDSIFGLMSRENVPNGIQATAWLWILLETTLFVDKSENRVKASCLHELTDKIEDALAISWGSATLANLYRELGVASRGSSKSVAGCLTLLQAWIYEYFPCFRPNQEKLIVDVESPRACMWSVQATDRSDARLHSLRCRLEKLTHRDVTWLPYGTDPISAVPRTIFTGWLRYGDIIEAYMPGRAIRQLGYVQTIPTHITTPAKAVRPWDAKLYKVEHTKHIVDDAWKIFPDSYVLPLSRYTIAEVPGECCGMEYIEWYYNFSHPRLLASEYTEYSDSSEESEGSE